MPQNKLTEVDDLKFGSERKTVHKINACETEEHQSKKLRQKFLV